MKNKKLAQF